MRTKHDLFLKRTSNVGNLGKTKNPASNNAITYQELGVLINMLYFHMPWYFMDVILRRFYIDLTSPISMRVQINVRWVHTFQIVCDFFRRFTSFAIFPISLSNSHVFFLFFKHKTRYDFDGNSITKSLIYFTRFIKDLIAHWYCNVQFSALHARAHGNTTENAKQLLIHLDLPWTLLGSDETI